MPRDHREPSLPARARLHGGVGLAVLLGTALALASLAPVRLARLVAGGRILADGGRLFETSGMVLQDSLWTCGPAALHNLLRRLGVPSPGPGALARMTGTGPGGSSLGRLVRAARTLGVPLRARRVVDRDLRSVRPPFLAWLDGGHFVTVLAVEPDGRVSVHDPMVGAYRLPSGSFARRWAGVVADLAPADRSSPAPGPADGPGTSSPSDRRSP